MTRSAVLVIVAGSIAMSVMASRAAERPALAMQIPASPPPLDAPLPLPDGPGKVLVEQLCKGCHEAAIVMTSRETREGWETVVTDMVIKGTKATPAEREIMVDYLAEHRGLAPRPDARGASLYARLCLDCHGADGQGKPGQGPGLVGSPLAIGPADTLARVVLHGKASRAGQMPPAAATTTDDEIAAVATYVRQSWGHRASVVTAPMVAAVRSRAPVRTTPWTDAELEAIRAR